MLHESIHDVVVERVAKAYKQVRIGDPWDRESSLPFNMELCGGRGGPTSVSHLNQLIFIIHCGIVHTVFQITPTCHFLTDLIHVFFPPSYLTASTLYGPLHTKQAVDQYLAAIEQAKQQGGTLVCGGKVPGDIHFS